MSLIDTMGMKEKQARDQKVQRKNNEENDAHRWWREKENNDPEEATHFLGRTEDSFSGQYVQVVPLREVLPRRQEYWEASNTDPRLIF